MDNRLHLRAAIEAAKTKISDQKIKSFMLLTLGEDGRFEMVHHCAEIPHLTFMSTAVQIAAIDAMKKITSGGASNG